MSADLGTYEIDFDATAARATVLASAESIDSAPDLVAPN